MKLLSGFLGLSLTVAAAADLSQQTESVLSDNTSHTVEINTDRLTERLDHASEIANREVKRVVDQVTAEVDQVAPKVEKETSRIIDQVQDSDTHKKVEKETKRVLNKLGLKKKKK